MYEIGELLFGRMNGPLDMAATAATVLGALLLCAALVLISRRNDVGWMLAVAAMLLPVLASALKFPPLMLDSPLTLLLFAAGAQLLALGTHAASLFGSDVLTWSIVTTRMVVWVEIMILGLIGVWEATAAPYARPQTSLSAKSRIA